MKYQVTEITQASDIKEDADFRSSYSTLKKVYGDSIKCFALRDKGENVIAFFGFYYFNKLWQKHSITPPFLTDIQLKSKCSAKNLAQINSFNRDVISAIAEFLEEWPHTYLELVLPKETVDALPFVWKNFNVGIKYTYLLDLGINAETLLENMSTQRRKNIRDAEKQNLKTKEIVDAQLISDKASELLASKNAKFNKEIVNQFTSLANSEHLTTIGVYDGTELVAFSCAFSTKEESTYLFGWHSNETGKSYCGTYALWSCILACKEKSRTFNFAGSQIPSVEKYFRGFGGTLQPLISIISDKRKLTKQFT